MIGANPIAPVWGVGQAVGKKQETQRLSLLPKSPLAGLATAPGDMPARRPREDQQCDTEEEHPNRLPEAELIGLKASYQCSDHQEETNEIPDHSSTDLERPPSAGGGMAKQ